MFQLRHSSALLVPFLVSFSAADPLINVHIVPHTHDDVGWLKTVDEYYAGLNNSIQHAYVRMIIDTVVSELAANPNRTFTYVEQAFFQRWWRQQPEDIRELTRQLVKSGQLEFTNGGWCMHDEAAPHYMDMIDQTTLGHKFLMDEFGVAPKTGWQLDPFGHSATQAALLSAEVGFEGLFFGRIDWQDLNLRRENKEAEFIWRASPSLGKDVQVFSGLTGEYGGNYGPPGGFDWNVDSNDEPIQDDANLEDYNVKSRVDDFVAAAQSQAAQTRGVNIMWTMGSDFQYEDAHTWFYNLDKIIKHVNEDGRVRAFYSTPSKYLESKINEDVAWPLKQDDFFPYADGPHAFWTGYFTSRPALKRYIRDSSGFFQVAKQIATLSDGTAAANKPGLGKLAEALGVAQHHDAVSGTAKQHVTFDYAKRIAVGRTATVPEVSAALGQLLHADKATFSVCDLRNVSVCAATQSVGKTSKKTCFALWNGLAQKRHEYVELPVSIPNVQVTQMDGTTVPSQLVSSLPSVGNYGQDAGGSAQTLLIEVNLPPMGASTFCLEETSSMAKMSKSEHSTSNACTVIENQNVALEFCDGSLSRITDKVSNSSTRAQQSWLWYESSVGTPDDGQRSGAYIFRPNSSDAKPAFEGVPSLTVFHGPLVDEVHQTFGSWISQRWRLHHDARHAELTYTVGPIPWEDGLGKEVISRISTDLQTNGECYSDSNGREMLYRKHDFRPSWKFNQTEEVAGNYFPVTTSLFIKDQKSQLTILTDASQAATGCLNDGDIEFMVHRRVLEDDSRGVGEPLNETQFVTPYIRGTPAQGQHYGPGLVVRGQHFLVFAPPAASAAEWRPLADRLYLPPLPLFTGDVKLDAFSALKTELPKNLQIVTLSPWDNEKVLLRIAHQFGLDEDAELSKPVTIDLQTLFAQRDILVVKERGLAATISRDDVLKRRINWKVEGEDGVPTSVASPKGTTSFTFGPLQIRTFLIKLSESAEILI